MIPLSQLLLGLPGLCLHGPSTAGVSGVTQDSRAVASGFIFAALPGSKVDGLTFAPDAAARGAAAVLAPGPPPAGWPGTLAWIEAPRPREALAHLARRLHGAPDERLDIFGITGTNGKTTTATFLAAGLSAAGVPSAIGGTLGQSFGPLFRSTTLTTPEAPELWSFLAESERRGARAAVLEVSSAALTASRVHGMRFRAAVLTGIGSDHLDVHQTHAAYRAAKLRLFEMLPSGALAVIPEDDPFAPDFRKAAGSSRVVTFGETERADYRVLQHQPQHDGARFRLEGPSLAEDVFLRRPGPWDARNLAAAVAAASLLSIDLLGVVDGAAAVPVVPGRWEVVDEGQPFLAVVDFAHTPQALERALSLMRRIVRGKVIVVFGCGGERDPEKRPEMGRIAGTLADLVYLTDDNPRLEDPELIAAAILEGTRGTQARVVRLSSRALAIRAAVEEAGAKDGLVVAGKGHETYQDFQGIKTPFDDRQVLREALRASGFPS